MVEKLDKKDRKILYQLDIDCRQSHAEIGKKVGLSKEVVNYRIQRMENKGIIRWYGSVINTYKLGFQKYKMYIQLQNANTEKRLEIIKFMVDHKSTEWVALCDGRWDIIVGFSVTSMKVFKEGMDEILEPYSQYFSDKQTTITFGAPHSRKEWLLYTDRARQPAIFQGGEAEYKLDDVEEEIVKIMVNNARIPIIDMAKRIGVTPRIASYKLKTLQNRGIIMFPRVFLDLKKIGYIYCKTFIYLKDQNKEKLNRLISYCNDHPNATYNVIVVGPWDLEPEFEVTDFSTFSNIIKEMRDAFADIIRKIEFVVMYDEVKLDYFPGCYKPFKKKNA